MADTTSERRMVVAAALMVVVSQMLEIAADVVRRQSDPADPVALVLLIVLSIFLLRRARWARWTTVVYALAGGLLELVAIILLIATKTIPGLWSSVAGIPALAGLRAPVVALAGEQAFPLIVGLFVVSCALDLSAAGMLAFAPPVRSYFSRAR